MALGDNCSSSCLTRDHASWGECVRSKKQMVGWCRSETIGADKTMDKKHDADLAYYKAAHDSGIRPDATGRRSVEKAVKLSDKYGEAYGMGADFRVIPDEKGKLTPVRYADVRKVEKEVLSSDDKAIMKAGREAQKERGGLASTFGGE